MHKVPPAVGQVQTGRGRFAQPQRPRPGVDQPRGAGDDVGVGIHGVQQFQFQPGDGVAQAYSQRFGRAVLVMGGGQALQRVFAGPDLVADVGKVRAARAGRIGDRKAAQAEIPHVAAGILLRQDIGRGAPRAAVVVVVGRKADVGRRVERGQVPGADAAPVIQVQQMAAAVHLHGVGGGAGLQPETALRGVKVNTHGGVLLRVVFGGSPRPKTARRADVLPPALPALVRM